MAGHNGGASLNRARRSQGSRRRRRDREGPCLWRSRSGPWVINELSLPARGKSGSLRAREVLGESSSLLGCRCHTTALESIGAGDPRPCARGVLRRPARRARGRRYHCPALPGTGGYLLAGTLWLCALVAQGIEQRFPKPSCACAPLGRAEASQWVMSSWYSPRRSHRWLARPGRGLGY